jgi:anti-sigma factor RsiW
MTADHPEDRIGAFVDGELAAAEQRAVAAHLAGCARCAALAEEMRRVSRRVAAARVAVPPGLEARVRRALADATDDEAGESAAVQQAGRLAAKRPVVGLRRILLPWAASLVLAAALSAAATWWVASTRSADQLLVHDLLTAHLRALAQDGAVQVASSDTHTVKPWFAGKVDFSPEARDLAAQGFTLVGGRLDIIDGHRAGVLVYRRRLHLIDVFAWPGPPGPDRAPALRSERGYRLVTRSKAGVTYWAVSDLDGEELARFVSLL